jgi:hypothetical protein
MRKGFSFHGEKHELRNSRPPALLFLGANFICISCSAYVIVLKSKQMQTSRHTLNAKYATVKTISIIPEVFMESERLVHDLIVDRFREKFSGQYKEIKVNVDGHPDMILANHGLTLAVVEVETEKSITPERSDKWRELAHSGSKLILLVPKNCKVKTMELLWKNGLADKVGVGSYEITITMP